jgi:hypothetical protein
VRCRGIHPSRSRRRCFYAALQAASEGSNEQASKLLLEKNGNVNAQGGDYGTALQAASEGSNEQW